MIVINTIIEGIRFIKDMNKAIMLVKKDDAAKLLDASFLPINTPKDTTKMAINISCQNHPCVTVFAYMRTSVMFVALGAG